jgi:hypothetical protein
MSLFKEQTKHHLNQLERWLPGNQHRPARRPLRDQAASVSMPGQLDFVFQRNGLHPGRIDHPELEQTIADLKNIPEQSALLGVCEDGLPFLLDLANPSPGSVLVAGDPGSGKTALLRSILVSASQISKSGRVALRLITDQPEAYKDLEPILQDHFSSNDPAIDDLIANLVQIAESRKQTGPEDPASILVVDDLPDLLTFLNEKAFHELYWLIRHGPRYQIWTVAALPSGKAKKTDPRFLTAFRTRLFGFMQDEKLATRLAQLKHINTRRLEKGSQFFFPGDGVCLRFRVCSEQKEVNGNVFGSFALKKVEAV